MACDLDMSADAKEASFVRTSLSAQELEITEPIDDRGRGYKYVYERFAAGRECLSQTTE